MNVTLLIVLLIIFFTTTRGFKKGMTKEITSLISWTVTLFVMSLIIMLYTSFYANETQNIIFTVLILVLVGIVYGIVRIFLKSVKLVSKLPVLRFFDKLLGILTGIAKGFLLVWLLYVLNEAGILGWFGEMIRTDTANSEILTLIYDYNYLIKIAAGFKM